MSCRRLEGKRVVVVGAGQQPGLTMGIGRSTALLFAEQGAELLLVDKNRDSVEATRAMIGNGHGSVRVHVADISKEAECETMAREAERLFGGVDVLFNAVGIVGAGSAVDTSIELWDDVMNTNLRGAWLAAKSVLPGMVAQRAGSIVNVSAIAALVGSNCAYAISKAGLNRLTISIAAGYAEHDIRANAILPGQIDTPMAVEGVLGPGQSRADFVAARAATEPMAYTGSAIDVAYAALFLASDESRYVSGACIPVDGARLTVWR